MRKGIRRRRRNRSFVRPSPGVTRALKIVTWEHWSNVPMRQSSVLSPPQAQGNAQPGSRQTAEVEEQRHERLGEPLRNLRCKGDHSAAGDETQLVYQPER